MHGRMRRLRPGLLVAVAALSSPARAADFEVQDLRPLEGMSAARQDRRRRLLAEVEQLERERTDQGRARAMTTYYQRARDLMSSPEARRCVVTDDESGPGQRGRSVRAQILCWALEKPHLFRALAAVFVRVNAAVDIASGPRQLRCRLCKGGLHP